MGMMKGNLPGLCHHGQDHFKALGARMPLAALCHGVVLSLRMVWLGAILPHKPPRALHSELGHFVSLTSWRWGHPAPVPEPGLCLYSLVIGTEQGWFGLGWAGFLWFCCPSAPVSSSVEVLPVSNCCLTLIRPQKALGLTPPSSLPLLSWLLELGREQAAGFR